MGEPGPSYISYADFGQRFFQVAVTQDRVAEAITPLTGRPIEVGPIGIGPMQLIKVRATGEVGWPGVAPAPGEHVSFTVTIPIDLFLVIEMAMEKYRFSAAVVVRLGLTARAADPLVILIDIEKPSRRNIEVDVHAEGLRASVIQLVAGIDGEIQKAVAKFVGAEIDKMNRRIDIAEALHRYR